MGDSGPAFSSARRIALNRESRADHAATAMATGKGADHDFQYARCADGRTVLLHDIVKVIKGSRGVAERLRGVMVQLPSA